MTEGTGIAAGAGFVCLAFLGLVGSCNWRYAEEARAITEMTANGATPMEARCAIEDSAYGPQAACYVLNFALREAAGQPVQP